MRNGRRSAPLLAALALVPVLGLPAPSGAITPRATDFEVFAGGLDGPEGLAFTRDGRLIVGSVTGDLVSFAPDGSRSILATVENRLAGVTVLADGTVLAASVDGDRVWSVSPEGDASIFAEGIGGPNFILQSRYDGRILASASTGGAIVDITGGVPEVVIPDLQFPNGLAERKVRGRRWLYVALTLDSRVDRFEMFDDGSFGEGEVFAEGVFLSDGIAFDRAGNLLSVGGGMLQVVRPNGEVEVLADDPLVNWASNIAFGQGPGFSSREVYLANFGPNFGDGTDVIRFRYSIPGAPLASSGLDRSTGCTPSGVLSRRAPLRPGPIRCAPPAIRRLPVR